MKVRGCYRYGAPRKACATKRRRACLVGLRRSLAREHLAMPIIDTSTSRSISNLLRAQQTGFRDTVDEHGKLIRNTQLGGLKSRLVSLVGQGTVKPGSIAGRTIKLVVGKQNFENIFRQLQANADSSVRNVLTAFAKMETKGLDPDLRNAVAVRIHQRLGSRRTGFTARKFASVHNAIKDTLIPERLAARQALITSIEGGTAVAKDAGTQ